jgi:DNA-binding protein YbaB
MVLGAVNAALAQAKDIYNTELGKVTAGLQLPGMM